MIDLVALSREHPGKWVAVRPGSDEILAVGDTASDVFQAAQELGVSVPVITRIFEDYGALVPWLG